MLGEYGIDTMKEHSEEKQAEILEQHIRAVFDEGLVGTFIFSYTDDWFTGGYQIEDWAFGITRRDRSPKPACEALKRILARVPQTADEVLPMMQRDHLLLQRRQHRRVLPALDAAAALPQLRGRLRR